MKPLAQSLIEEDQRNFRETTLIVISLAIADVYPTNDILTKLEICANRPTNIAFDLDALYIDLCFDHCQKPTRSRIPWTAIIQVNRRKTVANVALSIVIPEDNIIDAEPIIERLEELVVPLIVEINIDLAESAKLIEDDVYRGRPRLTLVKGGDA